MDPSKNHIDLEVEIGGGMTGEISLKFTLSQRW